MGGEKKKKRERERAPFETKAEGGADRKAEHLSLTLPQHCRAKSDRRISIQ